MVPEQHDYTDRNGVKHGAMLGNVGRAFMRRGCTYAASEAALNIVWGLISGGSPLDEAIAAGEAFLGVDPVQDPARPHRLIL
jgi:hypothetical protein